MPNNTKKTSPLIASLASKTLRNTGASKIAKTVAGSALSQAGSARQTGAAVEASASKVLRTGVAGVTTRKLAGSVVSQANRKR